MQLFELLLLQEFQKVLAYLPGIFLLLLVDVNDFLCSLLQRAPVILIISSFALRFESLSLHKGSLTLLFVHSTSSLHLILLKLFNNFNSSKLKTFADEHLQDRLDLQFKVI